MDIRFTHPFTCCINGPTKSGKTEWVKRFVKHVDELMTIKPEKIIWCYSEWQPAYTELGNLCTFVEGIPDMNSLKEDKSPKLLIMDDLMTECAKTPEITQLFTRGCHHWNTSVVHIMQNLFYNKMRTCRINSHYIVLMKSPSDKLHVSKIGCQIYPGNHKFFTNSYDDACRNKFGYLLLDLNPQSEDQVRLRTSIFPGDICPGLASCYTYIPSNEYKST